MQSAGRDPIEGDDALKALEGVRTLLVAKGRKVERFDLADDRPGAEEVLSMLLGRSGKLRAPAMRTGDTLVVGFNQDVLSEALL